MNILVDHPATAAIAIYFLFSAIVSGMPLPTDKSSVGYVWFFHSAHILAGNLQTVIATKYPTIAASTTTVTTGTMVNIENPPK